MLTQKPDIFAIKRAAQKVLKNAHFACLLGSAMTSYYRKESDIDIAALFDVPPVPMECMALQSDLEEALNRRVDLIVLNQAGPVIKMQVLKKGKPLFIHDRKAYAQFQMCVISEYFDFKSDRMPVESARLHGVSR